MLTPAAKARQTRISNVAATIEGKLRAAMDSGVTDSRAVIDIIRDASSNPELRCDAFWKLDNDWRSGGHQLLRQCRNHPVNGKAMFALFSK
jgi:hypothetical protein